MPTAAWWREYRRRHAEHLRAYNRARRQQPKMRAQRHASEARRRARLAATTAELPALHVGHPLLEAARQLVPEPVRGARLAWWSECLADDLRSEAVLALLEGRDPAEAVARYRAREHTWAAWAGPLLLE